MLTAAFLGSRAPHSAIGMQSSYKMIYGTELDLRLLRAIGTRAFVHVETYSKKLEHKAVIGWVQQRQQELSSVQSGHPAHHG